MDNGWIAADSGNMPGCAPGSSVQVWMCYDDKNDKNSYVRVLGYWLQDEELIQQDIDNENDGYDAVVETSHTGFYTVQDNVFEPVYDVVCWQYLPDIPPKPQGDSQPGDTH